MFKEVGDSEGTGSSPTNLEHSLPIYLPTSHLVTVNCKSMAATCYIVLDSHALSGYAGVATDSRSHGVYLMIPLGKGG